MVKRLESSEYAFKMTLNRFVDSYKEFIDMYKNKGIILINKKLNVYDLSNSDDFEEMIEDSKEKEAFKIKKEDLESSFYY